MASSKHFLNASKLLPESSRTHISIVGIGYVLIAFNIISATTCGGFLITTPTSKRFEDQVVYLHLGCRRQNHQQLNYSASKPCLPGCRTGRRPLVVCSLRLLQWRAPSWEYGMHILQLRCLGRCSCAYECGSFFNATIEALHERSMTSLPMGGD